MEVEVFRLHAEIERTHWWFAARRRILRAVVEALVPPDRTRRVVDVGCGVGATAPAFHPDYTYIGYEPSGVAVDFARASHPGVEFHVGTAAEAAAVLAGADVVLLTDVIEHVERDRDLLKDTVRHMPAGSWLVVTVPAGMELWSPHDAALGHYRRYDEATLRAVCEGLPAGVAMLSYFNARLYVPVRAVRFLTALLGRAAGGAGTDLAMPGPVLNSALGRIFAGEATRLAASVATGTPAYHRGVSLMALLQRRDLAAGASP
jgi:SAM-dependent methyltransferase